MRFVVECASSGVGWVLIVIGNLRAKNVSNLLDLRFALLKVGARFRQVIRAGAPTVKECFARRMFAARTVRASQRPGGATVSAGDATVYRPAAGPHVSLYFFRRYRKSIERTASTAGIRIIAGQH
jgi:hypothetical protein